MHVAGCLSLEQTALRARDLGLAQVRAVSIVKKLKMAGVGWRLCRAVCTPLPFRHLISQGSRLARLLRSTNASRMACKPWSVRLMPMGKLPVPHSEASHAATFLGYTLRHLARKLPGCGMPPVCQMPRLASLAGLFFSFVLVGLADEPVPLATLPHTQVLPLRSVETGEHYRITVFLPPAAADTDVSKRFPVVYVLDGLWHFARLDSLRSALVFDQGMPEVILVGIDYPVGLPEVLALRQKDLTFGTAADPGPAGGAPAFCVL